MKKNWLVGISLAANGCPTPQEFPTRAGAFAVVVTPTAEMMDPNQKGPIYLGGYGQGRIAEPDQVWEDLWARTLIVEAGGRSVAFVGVDSVILPHRECLAIQQLAWQQLAGEGITIDHIIISSSHTHHAPDTTGLWGPPPMERGVNPHYLHFIIGRTAESIVQAALNMQPITELRFGVQQTSGLIRDSRDPIVMDENIYVMHVVGEDNQTIGTLVKWASHPETILDFYNEAITSDYVHFLRETVEAAVGGTTVFVNGALSGLLTSLRVDVGLGTDKAASIPTMRYIGKKAGEAALQAIRNSEISRFDAISIIREEVFLPLQNQNFQLLLKFGVLEGDVYINGEKQVTIPYPPELGGTPVYLLTEVSVVTIGEGQFAMVPGELYPEIAIGGFLPPGLSHDPDAATEPVITQHMTGKYNIIIGLANDDLGYIIPADDFIPLQKVNDFWGAGVHRVTGESPYGEINSVGPSTAPILAQALVDILKQLGEGDTGGNTK